MSVTKIAAMCFAASLVSSFLVSFAVTLLLTR